MAAGSTGILFISHGDGPIPLLGDSGHTEMLEHLEIIAGKIKKLPQSSFSAQDTATHVKNTYFHYTSATAQLKQLARLTTSLVC